ncbi:FlaG/FlaF family flagellin (archaellin) [Methanomicrobium sp. W14]|uniref:type IV pilin n=1 Tax=Methanomicrobium sp. W14 TaxID=2817839 RepID=UPI001FDAC4D7|nr:type IV pilin N-terminal domain-containing protein [Methanomicrobium sp. W14]MBP2134050.1 FlaG/FlaF family flagellin (archaellin) [Methanomicrobium sp. W14]
MNIRDNNAVSPVVGVMMMLVVTIIIAAVVSAFGSGMADSQSEALQAKIGATFSVSGGMTITHDGGDAIPLDDLVLITSNGNGFGPNAEKVTTQKIDLTLITDKDGNQVFSTNSVGGKSSFNPGDTLYITPYNCTCSLLQYSVSAPLFDDIHGSKCGAPWDWENNPTTYEGTNCDALWMLCFRNPDNVGKVFTFKASDRNGNIISKCDVKITS